jgi:hypothetical protein
VKLPSYDYWKLNFLPGAKSLDNKRSMWEFLKGFRLRYGNAAFPNTPSTYVLPAEVENFKDEYENTENKLWIQKHVWLMLRDGKSGFRILEFKIRILQN